MKKLTCYLCTAILAVLSLSGCASGNSEKTLKVVATAVPHAEILEFIQPKMEERGVKMEIIDTPDYQVPNRAVNDKEADANFFQHLPFYNQQVRDFGYELDILVGVHIEPLGFYSKKISSVDELVEGATISIPNDESNEARALVLLHENGIIKLDDPKNERATILNIVENPKNIKFQEIDSAMLARTLDDVDASVINSNYALQASLVPTKDAFFLESSEDNPYVNIVTIRKGDENREELKILKEVITSEDVRNFLLEKYTGSVLPTF